MDRIWEWIAESWPNLIGTVLGLLAGRWYGLRRARKKWEKREFLDRLMVSLNSVRHGPDGKPGLAIRTLLEKRLEDVLLNEAAFQSVMDAAHRTTEEDPILPLGKSDRWYVLNAVLNEVAEHFSLGALMVDAGAPTSSHRYLICLTQEPGKEVRSRKVRALVVRKELLLEGAFRGELELDFPYHATRLATLECMRKRYETDRDHFMEIELAVPSAAA